MGKHMQMSLKGEPQPGDEQKAQQIVSNAHAVLVHYAAVNVALRDDYKPFFPSGSTSITATHEHLPIGREFCDCARVNALDLIQWPAMIVTVMASWFVASSQKQRRQIGFWLFLVSNALWVVWAVPAHAYALLVLQLCLAVMNIRGKQRNT